MPTGRAQPGHAVGMDDELSPQAEHPNAEPEGPVEADRSGETGGPYEIVPVALATAGAGWGQWSTRAGLALVLVEAAQFLGTLYQGFAFPSSGPSGLPGDVFHRIGISILSNLGVANDLGLILAVALVSIPLLLAGDPGQSRARSITLWITEILSVLLIIGAVLAVRGRLHEYDLSHQSVTAVVKGSLVTYLIGFIGTAAVAFGAAARALAFANPVRRG